MYEADDEFVARLRASSNLEGPLGDVLITNWTGARQYRRLADEASGIIDLLKAELGGTK